MIVPKHHKVACALAISLAGFFLLQPPAISSTAKDDLKSAFGLIEKGDVKAAQILIDKVVKADPRNAEAYHIRSLSFIKAGDLKKAIDASTTAISLNKNYIDAYLSRALARTLSCPKSRDVLADYSKALSLDPSNPKIYFARGITYLGLSQKKEAIDDFTKSMTLDKGLTAKALACRGEVYSFFNEFDKALSDLNLSIKTDPKEAKTYALRSQAYCHMKRDYEKALVDANKALSIDPTLPDAYCYRGISEMRLGFFDKGLTDLNKSIDLNNKNTEAFYERAACFQNQAKLNEAIKDYSRVLELMPECVLARINRAICFRQQAKYSDAIYDCTKAIDVEPKAGYAYLNRAQCYLRLNDPEKAVADCNKLISMLSPFADHALQKEAYIFRAEGYELLKNYAGAIADYDFLQKEILPEPDPLILYLRGKAKVNSSNYKAAINDLSRAIQLRSRAIPYYEERARAYEKLGEPELANADRQIAQQIKREQK